MTNLTDGNRVNAIQWTAAGAEGAPSNAVTPNVLTLRAEDSFTPASSSPILPFGYSIMPNDLTAPPNPKPIGSREHGHQPTIK